MASCALTPGTVADGMISVPEAIPAVMTLHHPMGEMQVLIDYERDGNSFIHKSAGLVRTARKLAEGVLYVPSSVWAGHGGG